MEKYEELENAATRCRYGCEYQLRGPQVVDKVAAVVNNGVVLESDVDGLMKSVKLNSGGQVNNFRMTLRCATRSRNV